jgi:DNA-binding CsgD family transcriptional regulator
MKTQATLKSSGTRAQAIEKGRESFRRHAWGAAFSQLLAADHEAPLVPEHLVELAQAALLIGREAEGADILARAHQAFLSRGDAQLAARCAFWLGFTSLLNGEVAKSGGWLSRASRLLDGDPDCVEKGYLLLPTGYRLVHGGDAAAAHSTFAQATVIGGRFGDKDLVTLGLQGQGRALIRQGEVARGLALLDEAMVAVTAGEVSPLNAGGVYCSVLDACGEIFDLQRAQEWTSALEEWCASQPDLVPYRGHCLVRRAELLQLRGAWSEALEEAQRASEWLSRPAPKPAVGAAFYRVAELHRLRGKFGDAEEAYRQASQWRSLGPGLALLRLAQGQVDAASAAIRRMAEEVRESGPRATVLDACVEIMLAANDVAAARVAADELVKIAVRHSVPFLGALSSRASGAVLLAEGNARSALVELRQSWSIWCELQAPYEASRVRLLIALACRNLGDEDNAIVELTAARQTFQQLGAAVELSRTEGFLPKDAHQAEGPLTGRELQVLRLVAVGMTNRGIAGKLHISEKTVARHLSNIFTKLDLYSRTAAAAYAYDHNLV